MTRLYSRERDRTFTILDARETLDRFDHKSIWGGETQHLTITRIDKTQPMTMDNAMVLTVPEAFRHTPPAALDRAKEVHTKYHARPSLGGV